MAMNSHCTRGNVRGNNKKRKPQVLNLNIRMCVSNSLIESGAREHGRGWIGEIPDLPPPIIHLL